MILMMLFMSASCSSTQMDAYNQSLGSVKKSQEVSRLFKTYQKHPDYKYNYAGFMKDPEAVVGIDNNYLIEVISGRSFEKVQWKEFEPPPKFWKCW